MKNFFTSAKKKKIATYIAVFLVVLIVVFAGILIFYKSGKEPTVKPPQKEVPKEKTEEEIIHDLSVSVPGFQETEITEEIRESLAVPIKDSSGDKNKDQFQEEKIIESLAKPAKQ